jgi:hypothetical protein
MCPGTLWTMDWFELRAVEWDDWGPGRGVFDQQFEHERNIH